MMRRLTLFACVLVAGCGDDSAKPDAGVQLPLVTISGHVVAAPGAPVPIGDVTVSVVDPVQDVSVQTDDKGAFQLMGVSTNSDGKVRIYINGITGGGGPYITADKILVTDPVNQPVVDAGTIHLGKMDTNSIVTLDSTIADITAAAGGGPQKVTL